MVEFQSELDELSAELEFLLDVPFRFTLSDQTFAAPASRCDGTIQVSQLQNHRVNLSVADLEVTGLWVASIEGPPISSAWTSS